MESGLPATQSDSASTAQSELPDDLDRHDEGHQRARSDGTRELSTASAVPSTTTTTRSYSEGPVSLGRQKEPEALPDARYMFLMGDHSDFSQVSSMGKQASGLSYAVAQSFHEQPQPRQTNLAPSFQKKSEIQLSANSVQIPNTEVHDNRHRNEGETRHSARSNQSQFKPIDNEQVMQALMSLGLKVLNHPPTEPLTQVAETLTSQADAQEQMRMRHYYDASLQHHDYMRISDDSAMDEIGLCDMSGDSVELCAAQIKI